MKKVEEILSLSYDNKDEVWLKYGKTLRKLVGIFGMLLPVLLYVFLSIAS